MSKAKKELEYKSKKIRNEWEAIKNLFPIWVLVDRLNKKELGWLKELIEMKEREDKKSK